ncbi:MAG: hypothetical protein KF773_15235 [Deltaproteobacteria bacterium]|nr:hypothetical protein [Deltaproteobacteria bacterium]MCW5809234.1 hypothetical protein [Deltaproteobacteria bacterium]
MLRWILAGSAILAAATPAHAERRAQLQADLGLATVALAYEHPLGGRAAIQVEAGIVGTYFLPWFDRGDNFVGVGAGLRPTVFSDGDSRGWYVAPYLRVDRVTAERDGASGTGIGFSAGFFVGRVFRPTPRLDLRVGAGAQYFHFAADTAMGPVEAKTPFLALDAVVGYRL